MQAELTAIEDSALRRRFVLGCLRAIVLAPRLLGELAVRLAMVGAAVLALLNLTGASAGVRVEAVTLLVVLSILSWWGSRRPPFGPLGQGWAPRIVRSSGLLVVLAVTGWFLSPLAGGASHDPGGWWVAGGTMALYCAAILVLTGTHAASRSLLRVLVLVGLAALMWWVPVLLVAPVRAQPLWPVVVIVCTALLTRVGPFRFGNSAQIVQAAFGVVVLSALMIFAAAATTFALFPTLALDVAPPAGIPVPVRQESNQIEAMDPLVGELVFGLLLGVVVIAILVELQRKARDVRDAA